MTPRKRRLRSDPKDWKWVNKLESWSHLKFWDVYYKEVLPYLSFRCKEYLPHPTLVFKALELTPKDQVKVIIVGQDPYHTPGMAHGLAFSVHAGVKRRPPSLMNIFKEYSSDLNLPTPKTGDLTPWAQRGILLLNTVLTVEANLPMSHANIGWEKLTYEVIRDVSTTTFGRVFILWGKQAGQLEGAIEAKRGHLVIKAPHPSPYSASSGFFGHRPFSQAARHLGVGSSSLWKLP